MKHQLSDAEIDEVQSTIRESEEGVRWLLALRSLIGKGVKSNEIENKREKSEGEIIPRQQCL